MERPEVDTQQAEFRLGDALTEKLELPRRREGLVGWLSVLGLDNPLKGAN